jgi:hypothetical protein
VRQVLFVAAGVVVALAIIVGWPAWSARRTWSRLDSVAARFEAPDGFSELTRVRQGDGFCFVTCEGGEALITVVLDASEVTVEAACEEMRRSVRHLSGDRDQERLTGLEEAQCGYTAGLYDDARVTAIVAKRVDLDPLSGTRWMEEETIPNAPLIAWIEINSGIE